MKKQPEEWVWNIERTEQHDTYASFPKIGCRLRFDGERMHWFQNWMENAKNNLTVGQVYTMIDIQVNSSSTSVRLEETGDLKYELSWFTEVK